MSSASSGGARGARLTAPPEWDRLELNVRRLLDEYAALRRRADAAEGRVGELERALRDVSAGAVDPVALSSRIESLEEENRRLRNQVEQAAAGIRRLFARLQFLEDDR